MNDQLKIIPCSVIDIGPQKKRVGENHGSTSSRANYSPFPEEVCDLIYEYYLRDHSKVVDPFAGWGERHSKALEYKKEYIGFDISQEAISKAEDEYLVDNILADSREVDFSKLEYDSLVTCPPYWNLEKYANDKGIDRHKSFDDFLMDLDSIFKNIYDNAPINSIFCVMVGNWRKSGIYYDLENKVSNMFYSYGAKVFDKVIISRKKISKIKIMLPQCKRLGYSVNVNEHLLIFKKV